jgi:hypothetical protein
MAFRSKQEKRTVPTFTLPSLFGSHSSMVESTHGDQLILRDEKGTYFTTNDRLDTGLADPRRYSSSREVTTPNLKAVIKP